MDTVAKAFRGGEVALERREALKAVRLSFR